jgi:hypothetical protein
VGDVERVPVRRAAIAALAVVLVGCSSKHARPVQSGAIALPSLPAQGLIDERPHGVALRDLRGRRLAWLPGFAVNPRQESAQASIEFELSTRLPEPLLHGPHGWYRLDATRHVLLPFRGGRLRLAGGATAVARRGFRFAIERSGHAVLRGGPLTFQILSARLVQAGRTLLDIEANRRWKLPSGCLFAGFRGRTLILACGIAHGAEGAAPLVLERLVPGGTARPLAPRLAELVPKTASLSPDRSWVAVEGDTGCAGRWVYVAPTRGGAARIVYGRSAANPFGANFSKLLGWSADGRLVVLFEPPYCDEPYGPQHPPDGVYLVDPRTLARTFVTKTADAMWNPAPRHRS